MNFTEDIDLSSVYKGKIKLQLIDEVTGEVTDEVEGHNDLTPHGLKSLMWGFK
jgi:hypothetical protein